MTDLSCVTPVIMSGGSGTRLWPLSRTGRPKQFIALAGDGSLFGQTLGRVSSSYGFASPIIVGNVSHRFLMAEELRLSGDEKAEIILEPMGRNTAAVAAVAALTVEPDQILLILPSDHQIGDEGRFLDAVRRAANLAGEGYLCCFAIKPDRPETGYGYIQRDGKISSVPGGYHVRCFREKPDQRTAEEYLESGEYFWNGGIFAGRADVVLTELEKYAPDVLMSARSALEKAETDMNFLRLDEEAFAAIPDISFDYAVMEKTDKAAFVTVDFPWSDLGSFSALGDLAESDAYGNALVGDVLVQDCRNNYIHSERQLVACQGLENMIIVATDDAVLVTPADKDQNVKSLVNALAASGREEVKYHRTIYRPWGQYRPIAAGDRFQVKEITVGPGKRLSLQKHHHRAEHWVVVQGTALVTRDEDEILLTENQSIYLPVGTRHRLENPGSIPLHLIEIQSGSYLGEDDIVRFEDDFGRSGSSAPD